MPSSLVSIFYSSACTNIVYYSTTVVSKYIKLDLQLPFLFHILTTSVEMSPVFIFRNVVTFNSFCLKVFTDIHSAHTKDHSCFFACCTLGHRSAGQITVSCRYCSSQLFICSLFQWPFRPTWCSPRRCSQACFSLAWCRPAWPPCRIQWAVLCHGYPSPPALPAWWPAWRRWRMAQPPSP